MYSTLIIISAFLQFELFYVPFFRVSRSLSFVAKIVFLCSEVTAVSTYFIKPIYERLGFSDGSDGKKNPPAMRESWV